MQKKILVLCLFFVLAVAYAFAQEESFTITTYYPSPYGSYNELQTNKLAIGDTNGDGQLTSADQPSRAGDVAFKPQAGIPSGWLAGIEGQLAYSSSNDAFYYYNGSTWTAQGGGGAAVISLKCLWAQSVGPFTCIMPSCPVGWTDVGTGCAATGVALGSWSNVFTGYCERWCYKS